MSAIQPYTKEFSLTGVGGTPSVETLRFPARGTLKRFIAVAAGGSGNTGTVKLYSTAAAAETDDPLYLIATATLVSNAYDSGAINIDYANREGSFSLMVRKLYAKLSLLDAGDKTLTLSLTVEQPQF